MKASVERLRWGLAAAALLLLVILVAFISYGRYVAGRKWTDIIKHSGVHISHETDGYTYSQSLKGRTVFTLHAAKAVQHDDGKWSLHDVVVTLYGKTANQVDHIYGNDFEYDENTGVARAIGEVHMDIEPPGALAPKQGAPPVTPENDRIIHIRTSGLVYVRKLSVAATDQPVEFHYAGLECTAQGAEFDSGESLLHLLADVRLTGNIRNTPITINATHADLDRQTNTVALTQAVAVSQGRTARAANSIVYLRSDGSLDHAEGNGAVTLDAATRHITADNFAGTFSTTSVVQTAHLTGNVTLTDTDPQRPTQAHAKQVDAVFNPQGEPISILAAGSAQVSLTDNRNNNAGLTRGMQGDRILATFTPSTEPAKHGAKQTSHLTEIHATGAASARGESLSNAKIPERKLTQVFADDLRALFTASATQQPELHQVLGAGHTRLEQTAPQNAHQTSTGDALDIQLASAKPGSKATTELASATQTGHVTIHSQPATKPATPADASTSPTPADASADHVIYDGPTSKLTLTGTARFTQGGTTLTASTIAVDQHTGDAEAATNVQATLASSTPQTATTTPTHVTADHAHLAHDSQLAEFRGTPGHPARLWQAASQVEANILLFDQKKHSLSARPAPEGQVHAIFASAPQNPSKSQAPNHTANAANQVVRVESPAMDYSDLDREATFSGGVHIEGATGEARSQRAVVLLNAAAPTPKTPNPTPAVTTTTTFGGTIRRIILLGGVQFEQPGRTGTGEQLVYTAVDQNFILTGTPAKAPHITDAQQGSITGATLLFHSAGSAIGDNTIIVAGEPKTPSQPKAGRVRTETDIKQ